MQQKQKASWLTRFRQSTAERNQRRFERSQQPPWIWKIVPENKRKFVGGVLNCFGMFSIAIVVMAAMWGMVFAPLAIAAGHKGSLLEEGMRWYVRLFPKNSDGSAYVLAQLCISGIFFYFIGIAFRLNRLKRDEKGQSEKSKPVEIP